MDTKMIGTIMAREVSEIPEVLHRQIQDGLDSYLLAGQQAAQTPPRGFVTCARGTSDHAATFFKYVMETRTGLPVTSIGPSIASVYKTPLKLQDLICLTISQSGGSPDLVALQAAAKQGGAQTLAFLNVSDSPVGRSADTVLDVLAGPEKAVAATKSFVNTLFAILGFAAGFTNDKALETALRSFPDAAKKALNNDWSKAQLSLARAGSAFTVGRGPGFAVAAEAALKLKETCRIHAEVFSAAELLHGPVVLADNRFASMIFDSRDETRVSIQTVIQTMGQREAIAFVISPDIGCPNQLPVPTVDHPLLHPLVQIIGFYSFVEKLARNLGENADAPSGLNKVTVTV
ncbi:SIS domain-containing protein [Parasedimentitalea denitrificans]|nr:SIS domain-containing protein [Sedimentitalea sp. CY04]